MRIRVAAFLVTVTGLVASCASDSIPGSSVPPDVMAGLQSTGFLLEPVTAEASPAGLLDAESAADAARRTVGYENPEVVALVLLTDPSHHRRLAYVLVFEGLEIPPLGGPRSENPPANYLPVNHELVAFIDAANGELIGAVTFR